MNIRIWYVNSLILSLNVQYYEKYIALNHWKVNLSSLFYLLNNQECTIFIYWKLTDEILYFLLAIYWIMSTNERKNSAVGIAIASGAGIGFVLELFASREIPFGTGLITGAIIGLFLGNFVKMLIMPWRQR